jgi:phosphatidylserine decarboxylase
MTIHKEGYATIGISLLVLGAINAISIWFLSEQYPLLSGLIFLVSAGFWLFLVSFFRIPNRVHTLDAGKIICPADGLSCNDYGQSTSSWIFALIS